MGEEHPSRSGCLRGLAASVCLAHPSSSDDSDAEAGKQAISDSGELRLQTLGYKQELRRVFGLFTSTCSSLSLMAFSSGLTGFFIIAYGCGGPVTAVWGWVLVSITNLFVALSMAEIVSSYPIAGGPYFWCLELVNNDPRYVLIGWCTGWMNVLGQFAATSGNASLLANHIASMWLLGNNHVFSPMEVLLAYAIVLVLAAFLSSTSTRATKYYAVLAGIFLIASGVFASIVLPMVAPTHQSTASVFLSFHASDLDSTGIPNVVYLFLVGMLMAQGTYIGFEAPAQFAEETKRADRTVPRAIVLSVVLTAVLGFAYLLAIIYSMEDYATADPTSISGNLVARVMYDAFNARFGSSVGALLLLAVPLITTLNSTVLSLTTNARMLWSFSRDGGVPLYKVWAALNVFTGTPVNAVWAMAALAFLLGLPMLWSFTVFQAVTSISSVALYTSYAIPIFLRMFCAKNFKPGPFKLGRWQPLVNCIAVAWIVVSIVAFIIPTNYPVSYSNFNWTPVTVGVALLVVLGAWFLPKCGATYWYYGKSHTLGDESGVRGAGRYPSSSLQSPKLPGGNWGLPEDDGFNTMSAHALVAHIKAKQAAPLPGIALTRAPGGSGHHQQRLQRSMSPRSRAGAGGCGPSNPRAQPPQLRPSNSGMKRSNSSTPKLCTLPEVHPIFAEGCEESA